VTGTNGKTTCTTLLGEIFAAAFGDVFVGGNIGRPLMEYVREGRKSPYLILEISSFQLETIETFHPHAAVLLNVAEDHLDRYRTFDDYVKAKVRIFENQDGSDWAIVQDRIVMDLPGRARRLRFSSTAELAEGAFVRSQSLVVRLGGEEHVYQRNISPLVGVHNTENILAVLLVSHLCGIGRTVIEGVLSTFRGLPHRIEFIRELGGVRFYNDSKATNVDAAKRALEGFDRPVVLVAGGKDKGGSYRPILDFPDTVKALVVIGEAQDRISAELGGTFTVFREESLGDAVSRAFGIARPGEVVLFSPMCSSFDMFRDYKDRGNRFREAVEAL
jgi:UDP-N-acetylmuramoylalanine--D-glutamate ligase